MSTSLDLRLGSHDGTKILIPAGNVVHINGAKSQVTETTYKFRIPCGDDVEVPHGIAPRSGTKEDATIIKNGFTLPLGSKVHVRAVVFKCAVTIWGQLYAEDCHFLGGVKVYGQARVNFKNCVIGGQGCDAVGICIKDDDDNVTGGKVTLKNCLVRNCDTGIWMYSTGGDLHVFDSVLSGNANGIVVDGNLNSAVIVRTSVQRSSDRGVKINAGKLELRKCELTKDMLDLCVGDRAVVRATNLMIKDSTWTQDVTVSMKGGTFYVGDDVNLGYGCGRPVRVVGGTLLRKKERGGSLYDDTLYYTAIKP